GAAAAALVAQSARAAGIAQEHAGAAGVIVGVLVARYLAASEQPGLLRLLLPDPVPVSDNARLVLELVGPDGEVAYSFAGLLWGDRPPEFFGHPWFEEVAACAGLPLGLSDFDFVCRQVRVFGSRDESQVAAASGVVRGAMVGLDGEYVNRTVLL